MRIKEPRLIRVLGIAFVVLVMLAVPVPAFSQSCALCYTQAASAGARLIAALRSGILVLVIPPMFMSVGITVLAYKKRNQFKQDDDTLKSNENW
ncbi:MAG TPA: hypothetical protein VFA74_13110 [Terriglobales bacterium]|nr:hypothetical protein [Terriglobales bacterium]